MSRPWPVVYDELYRDVDNLSYPEPPSEAVVERMLRHMGELNEILKRYESRGAALAGKRPAPAVAPEETPSPERCNGGKYCYSKREAQQQRNARVRAGVDYLRIYECPVCGKWHLTKQRPKCDILR